MPRHLRMPAKRHAPRRSTRRRVGPSITCSTWARRVGWRRWRARRASRPRSKHVCGPSRRRSRRRARSSSCRSARSSPCRPAPGFSRCPSRRKARDDTTKHQPRRCRVAAVTDVRPTTEEESRKVAEDSREQDWTGKAFIRELFLGNLVLDAIHPFPVAKQERPEFRKFYDELEHFLREKVDPVAIDETGEYPEDVVDGLR